jgi:hypothetical protein
MQKLPRVLSVAKTPDQAAKDLNQVQSGVFPVLEAAIKQCVISQTFTSTLPAGATAGYLQVQTSQGVFYLVGYAAPT